MYSRIEQPKWNEREREREQRIVNIRERWDFAFILFKGTRIGWWCFSLPSEEAESTKLKTHILFLP